VGNLLKKVILILIAAILFFVLILSEHGILKMNFNSKQSISGKKLVIGVANDSISLDPANTTEMDSIKVTVNIFETLVKYEKEGNNLAPCLAESWKASEDGLNFIFYLRKDVKFHDGTNFDAYAVVFNFQRWMNADSPYHDVKFSYWNYVFGGFPGFVKEVNAISDYIVQIRLKKPYGPFLNALAMPYFGIQSPAAIKKFGRELYKYPVGTGPFSFKSWEPKKSVILIKNSKYWADNAKVDEVEFRVIGSSQERVRQLELGNINIADSLGPDDVQRVESNQMLQLLFRPSFNVGYLAMNNQKSPFNNRKVRVAISDAIDKEGLISEAFNNIAKPAKTLIPPTLWGYNEKIKQSEYNPQKAIKLLAEAGYPNGFKTKLWVMKNSRSYMPKPMLTAQIIKKNLKAIKIDAEIVTFEWNKYLEKIKEGKHDLVLIGWTGDMVDPDNFLNTLLASNNAETSIAGNFSFYKNAEVDRMLTEARQINNIVFRKSLYGKLLEKVNYDMPSVPLVHTMPVLAAQLSVKGYIPGITGVESLEKVDIE
jgi:peptide/nickel transport system substrate-binding protein